MEPRRATEQNMEQSMHEAVHDHKVKLEKASPETCGLPIDWKDISETLMGVAC